MSEEEKVPRTVERQVAYGKRMYAGGQDVGAREEREAVVRDLTLNKAMDPDPAYNVHWIMGFQAARSAFARRFEAGEHRKEADHG